MISTEHDEPLQVGPRVIQFGRQCVCCLASFLQVFGTAIFSRACATHQLVIDQVFHFGGVVFDRIWMACAPTNLQDGGKSPDQVFVLLEHKLQLF